MASFACAAAICGAGAAEIGDIAPNSVCVALPHGDICKIYATFTGDLAPGDDVKVKDFVVQKRAERSRDKSWELVIILDSDGGDVDAAMKLGRYLRSVGAEVLVSGTGRCASSCVLVLAGGVTRLVAGPVLIHRPYFSRLDSSLSRQEVDARYKAVVKDVADYLIEMNVPRSLGDAMMTIPPEETRALTQKEVHLYMLDQTDPGHDEKVTADEASRYGLSSAEYRSRKIKAGRACPLHLPDGSLSLRRLWCVEGVLWGVSPSVLPQRAELFKRVMADPANSAIASEAVRACRIAIYQRGAASCP